MRVIVTTLSPNFDSELSERFGRSAYFLEVDSETFKWQAHSNSAVNARGGAGIQAAQFVADKKAVAVISGNFGPNAAGVLNEAGIAMYVFSSNCTVKEVIEEYKAGQLQEFQSP